MTAADIRVYPPGYGRNTLIADYRPWEADREFLAAWRVCRDQSLVDIARLYELWQLARGQRNRPGAILEVGSWRGGSAALIALAMRSVHSEREVYAADTFSGVVKAGERDTHYRGGEHADTGCERVSAYLKSLGLARVELLTGVFPEQTGDRIADRRLVLCHIDVDVYRSAADVFTWAWPRLVDGGVCVFDDYGFWGCEGVTQYVEELRGRDDMVLVANVNGHAVCVKIDR